ncbi:hypothetical protein QT711_07845 [Sporosarcina saromensis]|uniref:DUF5590 domain-containing protein n=1 Tax=Sporosarcina saromensis TaxID=359365 RepID=A0ABU4G9S9_9BACL|nr:hypothetical protein [Sporosarcina saromensis]MDW0113095.1 hypothetical protein [Sporosarcina saromensis]
MTEQKRNKTLNTSVISFTLLIGLFLFKFMIWDEFIINNSASAALDVVEGQPAVVHVINDKQEIAIKPYAEGLTKGFWGWSVTDELSITDKNKPFKIMEETLQFAKKKSLHLVLVMDPDKYFDTVVSHSSNNEPIHLNRLVSENGFLYYDYSVDPYGELIFEGTTSDGKVKRIK